MRTLRIIEHISLDGVIQVAAHADDVRPFPYGDWTAPYRTPAGRDAIIAAHGDRCDLLLGRRTYDQWSTFWPAAPSTNPMAAILNAATKFVVTHRPDGLTWGPSRAVEPDLVAGVRAIPSSSAPASGCSPTARPPAP